MHSARASSTRLRTPYGSIATGASKTSPRPTNAAISRARSRCRACSDTAHGSRSAVATKPARVIECRPSMRLSATLPRVSTMFWKVRATPAGRDLVRPQRRQLRVAEPHAARRRPVDARDDVEAAGLARAVGPDQAMDLPRRDGEADIVERDEPGETNGQTLDHQRWHARIHGNRGMPESRCRPRSSGPPRQRRSGGGRGCRGIGRRGIVLGHLTQVEPAHLVGPASSSAGPWSRTCPTSRT